MANALEYLSRAERSQAMAASAPTPQLRAEHQQLALAWRRLATLTWTTEAIRPAEDPSINPAEPHSRPHT